METVLGKRGPRPWKSRSFSNFFKNILGILKKYQEFYDYREISRILG
jgi:hypothetical protein